MEKNKLTAIFIAALFLVICVPKASGAGNDLDSIIRELSDYLNTRIPKNTKVVFLNVKSDWDAFSEYILSALQENAVNDEVFSVVDRRQLEDIRQELKFQWSGEVSDKSAQQIGQMIGAQTIVSGEVTQIDNIYRIQVRAISVQSAAVQGQITKNVNVKDSIVKNLTSGKSTTAKKSTTEKTKERLAREDYFLQTSGFAFGGVLGVNFNNKSDKDDSSKTTDGADSSEKSGSSSISSLYGGADIELYLFRYFGLQSGVGIIQEYDSTNSFSNPLKTQNILQIPVLIRFTLPFGATSSFYYISAYGGLGINIFLESNPIIQIKSTSPYSYIVGGDLGICLDFYGKFYIGFQYNCDLSDTVYDYGPKKDLKYLGQRPILTFGFKFLLPFSK